MTEELVHRTIGDEGFAKIAAYFYQHMREDDLIGPLYPEHDWEGAEERLRDFLLFRFSGNQAYIEKRGHPRLRMRHAPYLIGEKERDRWLEIMKLAMEESQIPPDCQITLQHFFVGVADFMRNH